MQSFSRFISAKSRQGKSANNLISAYRAAGGHIRKQTALGAVRTESVRPYNEKKVTRGTPWKVTVKTKGFQKQKHNYLVTYPCVTMYAEDDDTDHVIVADDEQRTRRDILEAAWLMTLGMNPYKTDASLYARRNGEAGTHDEFMSDSRVIISETRRR